MRTEKFLINLANLFLKSDKATVDWIKYPKLKNAFYLFFFSIIPLLALKFILYFFGEQLGKSENMTFIFRLLVLIFYTLSLISLGYLTFQYYNFMVTKKNKIHFINIVYFYIISIILFAYSYLTIYKLYSGSFIHNSNLFLYNNTIKNSDLNFPTSLKFILYSGLQSMGSSYNEINSNSTIVSIYNYFQNIYSLGLISLLIAVFVNRASSNIEK